MGLIIMQTYGQEGAREQEFRRDIKEIVSFLDGWSVRAGSGHRHCLVLKKKGVKAAEITIREDKHGMLRVDVEFSARKYYDAAYSMGFKCYMNISRRRDPEKIAKSLQRQLIHKYLIFLDETTEQRKNDLKKKPAKKLAYECAKILKIDIETAIKPDTIHRLHGRTKGVKWWCTILIDDYDLGQEASISFDRLSKKKLLRILKIVAE